MLGQGRVQKSQNVTSSGWRTSGSRKYGCMQLLIILWSCVSALDHVGGVTYNRAVSHPEFLETHSIAHALTYTASDAAVTIIPPLL